MRMRAMVEENKNPDILEQEFEGLQTQLVEKIKVVYEEELEKYPAGVVVEIASSGEKDFRLYFDSNGKWSMRFQMSGLEIGKNLSIPQILSSFLFVTDAAYRNFTISDREYYLQTGKSEFTTSLLDKMKQVLKELG